jgi:hypothetical protein
MLGNRFYYLHPLLAGPIDAWTRQLDRIAGMRFDTVVVARHDRLHGIGAT